MSMSGKLAHNTKPFSTLIAAIGICYFTLTADSFAAGAALYPNKEAVAARQETQRARRAKEVALVNDIYKATVAISKESTEAEMKLYADTIPGTNVSFVMVPIEGGEFIMGSA